MKQVKRYFLSISFFFILFIATFYYIFKSYSINEFLETIKTCNKGYILLSFLCVTGYLFFGSLYLKRIFAAFQVKISAFQSLCYNCIEIYFSAVTPSSTGGQPIQAYYMAKDKIPLRKSTIVILINTILYKLVIVILGIIGMLLFPKYILTNGMLFTTLMILGFLINIIVIILFTSLIYSKKLPPKILNLGISILAFLHLLKPEEIKKRKEDVKEVVKDYHECALFTKKHPDIILSSFTVLCMQRVSLFLISYFIYRSFGLENYNIFVILFLQVAITQATDCVPFPGGVMAGESLTYQINTLIYGASLACSSMLLIRGISFYVPVIISSILFIIYHFKTLRKVDYHDRNL